MNVHQQFLSSNSIITEVHLHRVKGDLDWHESKMMCESSLQFSFKRNKSQDESEEVKCKSDDCGEELEVAASDTGPYLGTHKLFS